MKKLLALFERHWLKLILGIAFIFVIVISLRHSTSDEKTLYDEGYTQITAVPGVSFVVEKVKTDNATAVKEISSNVNFGLWQSYSYKNGEDTYLLFNISDFIIIAKKGTHFALSEGDSRLKTQSLNGIRFEPTGKIIKKGEVYQQDVSAQVVINNDTYNDFTGVLCTIESDSEYTLFVGAVDFKVNRDMLNLVADSFSLTETEEKVTEDYSIDLENEEVSVLTENDLKTEDDIPEPIKEPEVTPLPEDNEPSAKEPDPINPPEDVPTTPEKTPSQEPENVPQTETENATEEYSPDTGTFQIKTNQKEYVIEETKAYSSSIYSLLSIGTKGFANILNGVGIYDTVYIETLKVLNKEETLAIVNNYVDSGISYYKEFEIPLGMHLEAVTYKIKAPSKDAYVNVKLLGYDGEKLKHNGVSYSTRTYDIITDDLVPNEWSAERVCFYLVPNGCNEYVLMFGDNTNDKESCYYEVS